MALVHRDRVKETSATTGTGTYTLAGLVTGHQAFSAIGDGNTCYYNATNGTDWETGIGTYTLAGTLLARTTILKSSNGNAAVNWGAGTKTLICTLPSDKVVILDASGNITFVGSVTLSADPAAALQAATKQYVDALAINVGKRERVTAATTANITISTALNNGDTLDGVTLATGDLILVKDQSTPAQNGIYVVGVSPARYSEYDSYNEHPGSLVTVAEGTVNADTIWLCTSNDGGTLDSTAIAFSQFSPPMNIVGLTTKTVPVQTADSVAGYSNADAANRKFILNTIGVGKKMMWIPARAMVPRVNVPASSGIWEGGTNRNTHTTMDFDTTTQEFAYFSHVFEKGWNGGTVTFMPVWSHPSTTTNFGVVFALQGVAISNDDAGDVAQGTEQLSTDTGGTTNDLYLGPESSAITIAGTPADYDLINFQVKRVPANGSDTLAVDARLHGIILFYTTDLNTDD